MPSTHTESSPAKHHGSEEADEGFGSLDSDTDPASLLNDAVSESTQTEESGRSRECSFSDDGMDIDEDGDSMWGKMAQAFKMISCSREVSTQTDRSPIHRQAYILAHDIVCHMLKKPSSAPQTRITRTMRRCVEAITEKHALVFNSMVTKLSITPETGYDTFVGVADELVQVGSMNWGRVVALYAFAGKLAVYCIENGMVTYPSEIAYFCGKYVGDHMGNFIKDNNGWDGLIEAFPEETDLENTVWKTLLVTGIGLGIATGATLLVSH